MARTLNQTVRDVTEDYIAQLNVSNPPTPAQIEQELVSNLNLALLAENQFREKSEKIRPVKKLFPRQIAAIMLTLYHIVRVKCGGENSDPAYDLLAIYMEDGPLEGIYVTDDDAFKKIASQYDYTISQRELKDVLELLSIDAPRVDRTINKDLIAVNNGIFDYENKTLMQFSSDYVFLSKSKVNYNPLAKNVTIHNPDGTDWDIESWLDELNDDPEVTQLLWQILGAIIRPFVRWNKSAWFYSNTGNNGKGTLCELMRSLCGDGSYAAIPLTNFSKDFALEPLTRASAIIVDENDVGVFIDKAANLKAVITNDVIAINRKFKTPVSYQFFGFMVQCLNEFPRIKDKSDSFYRRQIFIPFNKCFTGVERKYIKNDYLHRPEVLEYVMFKVLNMNYYTLDEPASCRTALEEYKDFNDPVRQFMDEVMPQLVWDLIPFSFLYDLYKAWFRKNSPNGQIQGRNTFIMDIMNLLPNYSDWYCMGRTTAIRPGHKMDAPELLISEYDLKEWMNPNYTGRDDTKLCRPNLKSTYNGLLRYAVTSDDEQSEEDSEEDGD